MWPNVFLLRAAKINGNAGREHRKICVLQSCPAILSSRGLRLAHCKEAAFYFYVSQMPAQAQEFSVALFQGLELAHVTGSMHKEQRGGWPWRSERGTHSSWGGKPRLSLSHDVQ